MDSEVHRKYTAFGNEEIQRNLTLLLDSGKPCILRIPLIPGVNDNRENLIATAERIRGYPGIIRLELLTYYKTAGAKYKLLGRDYEYQLPYAPPKTPGYLLRYLKKGEFPFSFPDANSPWPQ